MATENRDYLEMTFHSINCFANDGKLKADELDQILDIALRDGVVDNNEKRVLANIVERIQPSELTTQMLEKLKKVEQYIK